MAIVGAEHVQSVGRIQDLSDWWPLALKNAPDFLLNSAPAVIVSPASASEVADVLRVCTALEMAVTQRGRGSGVVGAAIPSNGGVLLDLQRLNRIGPVDTENLLVTAEAGVVGGHLEQELQAQGLTCGVYPQSLDVSTIGGWIATRATGTYSGCYGGIEDRLAGIEVALADGRCVRTPEMPRWAIGPNLSQLFLGTEGTLGVVTSVTLRLDRWPDRRLLRACMFPNLHAGLAAVRAFTQDGLQPAVVRLYDEEETRHHRALLSSDAAGCLLILAFDGPARLTAIVEELTLETCVSRGAIDLGREPAERWDAKRLNVPPGFAAVRQPGIMADFIDLQAPWDHLEETYRTVRDALLMHCTTAMAHFSHVYNQGSSIYFVISIEASDDEEAVRRYLAAWDAAMTAVFASGATIAHHHGIGMARAPWVMQALGDAWPLWGMLKRAFDPLGILNPGKLGHTGPVNGVPVPDAPLVTDQTDGTDA